MKLPSFLARFLASGTAAEALNPAQLILTDIMGDAKVADYKCPHAPRGTQPRPRFARLNRFATARDDEGNPTVVRRPRLFKGHQP